MGSDSKSSLSSHPHRRQVVILLHGIARTRYSMRAMQKALTENGYQVLNLDYASRKKSLSDLASALYHEHLEALTLDKSLTLHFVTHSMGALVVRELLSRYPIHNLGRVVMLAPPNQGSQVTDFLKNNFVYKYFYGPAGQQLTTQAVNYLPTLPLACEVGIIAGNKSFDPICYFLLPKKNDGKVSIESTKLNNMKDHIIVPATHTFIMNNKKVIIHVKHFLKHGVFDHSKN